MTSGRLFSWVRLHPVNMRSGIRPDWQFFKMHSPVHNDIQHLNLSYIAASQQLLMGLKTGDGECQTVQQSWILKTGIVFRQMFISESSFAIQQVSVCGEWCTAGWTWKVPAEHCKKVQKHAGNECSDAVVKKLTGYFEVKTPVLYTW